MYGPGALLADRYRLEQRVGGGGMGEVWRATDQVLQRTIAVKVMRPELLEEPGFAERFLVEARTMATIRHRGVVSVHDYRSDESGAFLVMEYVAGESLSRLLHQSGRLDPVRTMALVAQAADALQAAHERGVVHRDIKPANLLVTPDDQLVLTDFGIARSAASTPLTATGAVIGTPSYLAPEQVLGKPATARSDVYALGVAAYECLAGRRPFDGENPFEIAMKRLREPPPTLATDAPAAVLAVIERAMAPDPEQRWPSAAELAAAARQATAPGAAAAPGTPAFAPARVPVPQPPRPLNPTLRESQQQPGRPATRPPATATPPPAAAPPAAPPPAAAPPAAPLPGWPARPPRPVTVALASLLLGVAGLCLVVYCVASAAAIDDVARVARQVYGPDYEDWRGATMGAGWLAVGSVLLLALLLLLFAALTSAGSRGARTWTFVLGFLTLCCCGPCWWFGTVDNAAQDQTTTEFTQALEAALPWYGPLAGRAVVIAATALLAALVLLMLPPANRYFRRQPSAVVYYPYYPYHHPHPPRR